jgi:hypothetical protein
MAIYRKGDDLTSLQAAAESQKSARKEAGAEARGEAGLGGGSQPRLSNLLVDNSSGTPKAFEYDYRGPKGKDGKPGKVMRNDVQVSGGAVAAHEEKRVRLGRQEAPEKVERGKPGKPTGKAPVDLVRKMLGKGTLTISQAEKANKRGLSSPIKKKKTK